MEITHILAMQAQIGDHADTSDAPDQSATQTQIDQCTCVKTSTSDVTIAFLEENGYFDLPIQVGVMMYAKTSSRVKLSGVVHLWPIDA